MKIKWIFFDIDNTLFNSKELALKARRNAVKAMIDAGLPAESVDSAYEKLVGIVEEKGSNYGEHFNELCKLYGKESSELVAAGVVAYHNTKFEYLRPFPDVIPSLEELGKNYKLGIITNGRAVKQWDKLIRLKVDDFFTLVVISEEVGFEKPGKEIFEEALKQSGCKAGEAVMVGDKETDIDPAKELGMHTICLGEYDDADYKIKSFKEIIGVVNELGRNR